MKAVLSADRYRRLKQLSFRDMNEFIVRIYDDGYDQGKKDLLEQQKREQAAAAPEITFGDQELYELLMGIPGFGPVRSMAVIDAIYEKVEGMNDGTEGKA